MKGPAIPLSGLPARTSPRRAKIVLAKPGAGLQLVSAKSGVQSVTSGDVRSSRQRNRHFMKPANQTEASGAQDAAPIPEFYANSIAINVSPFEVELQNLLVDSSQNLKGAVNVRMSPQTAWTLSKALEKNLAEYEAKFGAIALPDEIKKQFS